MPFRRFIQCDVFSPVPTRGNALAVVVDAEGLSEAQMRWFAAWTNLAETTFLLPPSDPLADYRVRILTPVREMPFAGHPTLGSCAAWLHAGGVPRQAGIVRQECGVGIVEVDISAPDAPAFRAPPTEVRPMDAAQRHAIVQALAIPEDQILHAAELCNGPVFQAFHLASAEAVLAVDSSRVRWPAFKSIGLIGAHPPGGECDYEVRMLAPSSGMSEDPITGSLNAALACWMRADGRLTRAASVAQGTSIGRLGRVSIRPEASGTILVGGATHVVVTGSVDLPD
ncbi:MAG: PhzF family phenazine biosynthesis protein [Burkholderiaceae bacterium]